MWFFVQWLLMFIGVTYLGVGEGACTESIPYWDFRDQRYPAWSAEDARFERDPVGLKVIPMGPLPTLTTEVSIPADAVSAMRLIIQTPEAVSEAYVGWEGAKPLLESVPSSALIKFPIPKSVAPGHFRSVWIPVAESSAWAGLIQRVGLVVPTEVPFVIERIELVAPSPWTSLRRTWDGLRLDDRGAYLAVPVWSLNSLPLLGRGWNTVNAWGGLIGLLGLGTMWIARRARPAIRGRLKLAGGSLVAAVLIPLIAWGALTEVAAWQVAHAMFAGRPARDIYASVVGADLVGPAREIARTLPRSTRLSVCPFGAERFRDLVFAHARFQFYPIKVDPEANVILVLAEASGRCDIDMAKNEVLLQTANYIVYRSR